MQLDDLRADPACGTAGCRCEWVRARERRTGNDEEGLGGVGEAGEEAADGAEEGAPALRATKQQRKPRQSCCAVRQQVEQGDAVLPSKLLRQVQSLPPQLHLPQCNSVSATHILHAPCAVLHVVS